MNRNGSEDVATLWTRRSILRWGSLGFFGLTLSRYLRLRQVMAAAGRPEAKAQGVILLWLNGGPSHVDTWDPKGNSSFKPISTNVPGIRISELLPRMARHMDKMAIIRTMHTEENNHGIAHHYAMTGHRPNPGDEVSFAWLDHLQGIGRAAQHTALRYGSRYRYVPGVLPRAYAGSPL